MRTVALEGLLPLKRYDAMISGSTSRSRMGGFGFGSDASVCFLGSTKLMVKADPPGFPARPVAHRE